MTATWNPTPPPFPPEEPSTSPTGALKGPPQLPFESLTPPTPPPASPTLGWVAAGDGGGGSGRGLGHGHDHGSRRGARVAMAGLGVLAALGAGFGARGLIDDRSDANAAAGVGVAATSAATGSGTSAGTGSDARVSAKIDSSQSSDEPVAAVAAALGASVVQISTTEGLGSGVIYDSSGLILTNAHVVGSSSSVTVSLSDSSKHEGTVLGADTSTDVAVVRVDDGTGLTAARLAESEPVVGQIAVALGSPFGLDGTVTQGIVSAVNRPVDNQAGAAVNMIQTDAAINPGNSGGALANRDAEVIGINSSIYSRSGDNNGIGFAIPIATARSVADKIVGGGSLERAGLGITGSDSPDGQTGAYVQDVTRGGVSDQAGIRAGDLIVSFDGDAVKDMESLRAMVGSHEPGDEVEVTIERDGKRSTVHVTLGVLQSSSTSSQGRAGRGGSILPGN